MKNKITTLLLTLLSVLTATVSGFGQGIVEPRNITYTGSNAFNNTITLSTNKTLLGTNNLQTLIDGKATVTQGALADTAVQPVIIDYNATNIAGPVVAWGYNSAGETDVPASVTNAISIAAGSQHSLAALSNGTVVVWGGAGRPTITTVPISATNIIAVSAGQDYSLALCANGTVIGWGDRTNNGQINIPTSVTNAIAIAAGAYHSLALLANGTVIGWGGNDYGQTNIPITVTNAIAIAAGVYHSLALLSNGTIIGWGDNTYGLTNIPVSVTNAIAIAVSEIHCLALLSNSTIIGWGNNFYGESTTPASVINPTAISAGGGHSLAILQHVVTPRYSTQADYANSLTNTLSLTSGLNISNRVVVLESAETNLQAQINTETNRAYTVETNKAPLQSYLSTSNDVAVIKTNYTQLPDFLSVSNKANSAWQNPASATNWQWTSDGTQITLTNYTFGPTDVVIPDILDGLPVTGFGTVFSPRQAGSAVTSISGGQWINNINDSAFYHCYALAVISLPMVTNIVGYAFLTCTNLSSVSLPLVREIGANAFNNADALATISFPLVTTIDNGAFYRCDLLSYVFIPSVQFIGYQAFAQCPKLNNVTFSGNALGEGAEVYSSSGDVTNYITSPTATGWGTTWEGQPVVRLPLYGDGSNITGVTDTNTLAQLVTETNRAYTVETNLQAQINTETNRAYQAETNLQAQINTETNRAYQIETNLQAQIRIETNRAYSAETNLQAQINTETNRAYSAETNLQAQINTETNRAYQAETNLQAQINTETNRAYSVETNLQAQINTETNRAYQVETNLQAQINTETNRAYSVETNLQAQINTETNRAYTVETNKAPLQSYLSTSNDVAVIKTNYTQLVAQAGSAIPAGASYTNLLGMTALTRASVTNLVLDAMAQNEVLMTLTNDVTVRSPTNALVDGRSIKWRFRASGADRTVAWPADAFKIPSSSSMSNVIVVSNGTYSVFVTEYAAPTTNWLMQAYIWGY